jgi:hypothetical protein
LRYQIKINNKTTLKTIELKKFVKKTLEEFNKYYFCRKPHDLTLQIAFIYKRKDNYRGPWVGGHAWFNTRLTIIKIPSEWMNKDFDNDMCWQLSQTIFHELEHCKGKRHKEMRDHWLSPYPTDWAREYTIGVKVINQKQKLSKAEVIKDKADRKLRLLQLRKISWEAKLKRANIVLRKINSRIKYYGSKLEN